MKVQHTSSQEPESIPGASLRAKRTYTCADHPTREAFCLCAKCGKFLCEKCAYWITGRRFCVQCIEQDDALMDALRHELFKPQDGKPSEALTEPRRAGELPAALKNMFTNSQAFFTTAKNAPFRLTFPLAFAALVPASIVRFGFRLEATVSQDALIGPLYSSIAAIPRPWLIAAGVCLGALQVIILDFLMWTCIRVFTPSNITFAQTSSTLHFCLVPLVLGVFALIFEIAFIEILGMVVMLFLTGTAVRASTGCGAFQGFSTVIAFIVLGSLFKFW